MDEDKAGERKKKGDYIREKMSTESVGGEKVNASEEKIDIREKRESSCQRKGKVERERV